MPQKRKASKARVENLQDARGALSGKRQKSTQADSDLSDRDEERKSGDKVVHHTLSKHTKFSNDGTIRSTTMARIMLPRRHLLTFQANLGFGSQWTRVCLQQHHRKHSILSGLS
jgi:hypothetical protein